MPTPCATLLLPPGPLQSLLCVRACIIKSNGRCSCCHPPARAAPAAPALRQADRDETCQDTRGLRRTAPTGRAAVEREIWLENLESLNVFATAKELPPSPRNPVLLSDTPDFCYSLLLGSKRNVPDVCVLFFSRPFPKSPNVQLLIKHASIEIPKPKLFNTVGHTGGLFFSFPFSLVSLFFRVYGFMLFPFTYSL